MHLPPLERTIFSMSIVGWAMILLPSAVFLTTTWRSRRDRLVSVLGADALALYFEQFFPSDLATAKQDFPGYFKSHFGRLYGRRHWMLPILSLAFMAGIVVWLTVGWLLVAVGWDLGSFAKVSPLLISAALGAYSWCLVDQFARMRSQDFSPHDVYGCVLRLLVGVPLAIAISYPFKQDVAIAVAFLLGSFPTEAVFRIARRIAAQRLGVTEEDEDSSSDLIQLQGVGRFNAERYRRAGVTTIAELAWSDPVDLSLRTNLDLNFVIDCVSQALLWVYLEKETPKLYRFSLRGAQEVNGLIEAYDDPAERAEAEATLKAASASLGNGMDTAALVATLREVSDDPYTQFLCSIWQ